MNRSFKLVGIVSGKPPVTMADVLWIIKVCSMQNPQFHIL
jgi:hypothetical protein